MKPAISCMNDFWEWTPIFYEVEEATGITFYDEDFAWFWFVSEHPDTPCDKECRLDGCQGWCV